MRSEQTRRALARLTRDLVLDELAERHRGGQSPPGLPELRAVSMTLASPADRALRVTSGWPRDRD